MARLTRVAELEIVLVSLSVALTTFGVAVRFWSRALGQHRGYGWDDWLCLLALLCSNTFYALGISYLTVLYGPDSDYIKVVPMYELIRAMYVIYGFTMGFVKLSALCFYARVFSIQSPGFKIALSLGKLFGVVFILASLIIWSVSCTKKLVPDDPTSLMICYREYTVILLSGILDAFTDLYILVLPLPCLWKLNMTPTRRWRVMLAFVLGYCCLILSTGRSAFTIAAGQYELNSVRLSLETEYIPSVFWWFAFAPGTGVASICVPSWWFIHRRCKKHGFRALFTFTLRDLDVQTRSQRQRQGQSQIMFGQLRGHRLGQIQGQLQWMGKDMGIDQDVKGDGGQIKLRDKDRLATEVVEVEVEVVVVVKAPS